PSGSRTTIDAGSPGSKRAEQRVRAELPSGTVTFLFSDIERSTRLLRQLGTKRYAELLTQHNRVLRDALVGVGGAEIDRQGDSIFAVFSSAGAAVAAAVDAQRTIARQAWPDDATVRVRMGLHT